MGILDRQKDGYAKLLFLLLIGCIIFFVAEIALGSVNIPLSALIDILLQNKAESQAWTSIILNIRFPRAVTAFSAGAGLAVAGLLMQTLFSNPLAGPSVLGISSGASFGVATVLLGAGSSITLQTLREMGIAGSWLMAGASAFGASAVLLLVLLISFRVKDAVVLLITGLMIGNMTLAIVSIWQYFSAPELIRDYLLWTFGNLGNVTGHHLFVMNICILLGIIAAFLISKPLNMLLLGENYAKSMGMHIKRNRILIIIVTGLLTGSITAFCGPLAFVGIAVPHLARGLVKTSNHLKLIPVCVLCGALVMIICDLIARLPGSSSSLPVNAVTSLAGSPVVIWVILKGQNLQRNFR
ncbi:iron ABC transporter permease [Chondrinema litorale]|uniref:iron ABC transporter permease n=1 Tax=Chondrinema litorale TaxID=2994555 RepID=UPI002542D2BB|nr:iron ABC transporter permease [Chondrinema litorale]UZR98032.1 iron ABC transporter permease [Chondrinema litorale]